MNRILGKWIKTKRDMGDVCPVFIKEWECINNPVKAELIITALGTYCAFLNEKRIGDYVLAPGWTTYEKRLQYQVYDITSSIRKKNRIEITVGKGWYRSPMLGCAESKRAKIRMSQPAAIYGVVRTVWADGKEELMYMDTSWRCAESPVKFSEIYDGEKYDARCCLIEEEVEEFDGPTSCLIPQEGEIIKEQERICAKEIIVTPKGETVIDFGQEISGYVEFDITAHQGDKIRIRHGEVLDKSGNFYNENYRSAKAEIEYICKEGYQKWHPQLTFFGFRYICLEEFPDTPKLNQFRAIAVYSFFRQTGYISSSNKELNQLFSNVLWGQRSNFIDVPTDCPQRDERLGWTGDAQVFIKTAAYNFDVERFFVKWLHDMAEEQFENGGIGHVVPDWSDNRMVSAAWGDAVTICPWQLYLTYGNTEILREMFGCMKKWVDYITNISEEKYLWTGGAHFGDWLGLDAAAGSYKGASRDDFIASAFYAHSCELLIKTGRVLGRDVKDYEALLEKIKKAFQRKFQCCYTQTEYALSVWFGLSEHPQKDTDKLVELIKNCGYILQTGFVGTPYVLHVLSNYGYTDLAYTLLLRRKFPSWLYSVRNGATTMWEHWDGIKENGEFWDPAMNSFNHYAYGAVVDWIYEEAAGISPMESAPGFEKVKITPKPNHQLEWLEATLHTKNGKIRSKWTYMENVIRFEIETEIPALIKIGKEECDVRPGKFIFYTPINNEELEI